MGLDHSTVSQVERGRQEPSPSFQEKAAAALGVSAPDLWPRWWFLSDSERSGIRVRAFDGRALAFTSERKAIRHATRRIRVCGPAAPAFFALVLGVTEADVPGRLLVDPTPRDLEKSDGAGPGKGRAVLTSEKPGEDARHESAG